MVNVVRNVNKVGVWEKEKSIPARPNGVLRRITEGGNLCRALEEVHSYEKPHLSSGLEVEMSRGVCVCGMDLVRRGNKLKW